MGDYPTPGAFTDPVKIVVLEGPDQGREYPLETDAEVGSDDRCAITLADQAVSRLHAVFRSTAGGVVVRDLGSFNGTFLGGVRVNEGAVPVGAPVRMGDTVLAIYPRWHQQEVAPSDAIQFGELIGKSLLMREQFALMERVALTDLTVLIEGESGTGKELAARSIHAASDRADGPYVVFDCGSVPRDLAESELFGHARGAFSGAVDERPGLFQEADGGTICLDEIGELPLELQPKLLRVLETGEIRAVGSDSPRKVDVRVLAATNRVLADEVGQGRFRGDLLFRLEVFRVTLPPLNRRREDVPLLIRHFLDGILAPDDDISGENLNKLLSYDWPGNVRELRNNLLRAATLANRPGAAPARFDELVFNLGPVGKSTASGESPILPGLLALPYKEAKEQLLATFDREYIQVLLQQNPDNLTKAARAAGLSRKHLYQLIRKVDR